MQRLKLIRSLCLLSALVVALAPSIANAQNSPMHEDIRAVLPVNDPYCTANEDDEYPNLPSQSIIDRNEFNSNRALCRIVTISGTSVPAGVVDWVLVELRVAVRSGDSPNSDDANDFREIGSTGVTRSTVIARKPAFLLNNGRIVDAEEYAEELDNHTSDTPAACNIDGDVVANLEEHVNCPDLIFDEEGIANALDTNSDGADDDLYLVIRHRNHIDIMSAQPLTDDSGAYTYDFTANIANTKGQGDGIKAQAGSQTQRIAMYSGDSDYNGIINLTDYSTRIALTGVPIGTADQQVYRQADNDYNGIVNLTDYSVSTAVNRGSSFVLPR